MKTVSRKIGGEDGLVRQLISLTFHHPNLTNMSPFNTLIIYFALKKMESNDLVAF